MRSGTYEYDDFNEKLAIYLFFKLGFGGNDQNTVWMQKTDNKKISVWITKETQYKRKTKRCFW